jgi:acid phosphatase family membrane protein YuiD
VRGCSFGGLLLDARKRSGECAVACFVRVVVLTQAVDQRSVGSGAVLLCRLVSKVEREVCSERERYRRLEDK